MKFNQYMLCALLMLASLVPGCKQSGITKKDIASAERVIGLNFTATERDSMLSELEENKASYQRMREVHLDNAVPTVLLFNPIPVGFRAPQEPAHVKWSDYRGTLRPDDVTELAFYSVGQLAELIRTRKLTSEGLTRMYLERLKKYGPKLHCIITLTEKTALEQARRADAEIARGYYRGPLHGIPFGIKDLLATKGYKTTWGAMPYRDQYIDADATVVKNNLFFS